MLSTEAVEELLNAGSFRWIMQQNGDLFIASQLRTSSDTSWARDLIDLDCFNCTWAALIAKNLPIENETTWVKLLSRIPVLDEEFVKTMGPIIEDMPRGPVFNLCLTKPELYPHLFRSKEITLSEQRDLFDLAVFQKKISFFFMDGVAGPLLDRGSITESEYRECWDCLWSRHKKSPEMDLSKFFSAISHASSEELSSRFIQEIWNKTKISYIAVRIIDSRSIFSRNTPGLVLSEIRQMMKEYPNRKEDLYWMEKLIQFRYCPAEIISEYLVKTYQRYSERQYSASRIRREMKEIRDTILGNGAMTAKEFSRIRKVAQACVNLL